MCVSIFKRESEMSRQPDCPMQKHRRGYGFCGTVMAVLFLFSFWAPLGADILHLKDGSQVRGVILGASKEKVTIQLPSGKVRSLSQDAITSVVFQVSDRVTFQTGDVLQCKILELAFPEIRVATGSGEERFDLRSVKEYAYYLPDSLIISHLPATASAFHNRRGAAPERASNRALNAGLGLGGFSFPHDDWRLHFMNELQGPSLALDGFLGFSFSIFFIGAGLEYSRIRLVHTGEEQSGFSCISGFGRAEAHLALPFISGFSAFCGCDLGFMKMRGELLLYSYREIPLDASGMWFRPFIGLSADFEKRFMLRLGAGYEMGDLSDVDPGVSYLDPLNLDFRTFTVFFDVVYRFLF